jgi:hypothetical protein
MLIDDPVVLKEYLNKKSTSGHAKSTPDCAEMTALAIHL